MKVLIILSLVLVALADKHYFCYQEAAYGDCNGNISLWSYSQKTDECRGFLYSGCGGNHNRFLNEEDCIEICIDGADY